MPQYDFQGGSLSNPNAWLQDPLPSPPPPPVVPSPTDTAEINGQTASSGSLDVVQVTFDGTSTLGSVSISADTLLVDAGAKVTQNGASSTVTVDLGLINGAYQLTNGTLTTGTGSVDVAALDIGESGAASFTQSGGKNDVTGDFGLGFAGSTSTYAMSGGVLDTIRQHIGIDATGFGTFTQTGGTDNAGQAIILGTTALTDVAGTGEYDLSGTGTVNVGTIYIGSEPGGTGTFKFNADGKAGAALNLSGDPNPGYLSPGLIVGGQGLGTFTQGGGTVTINMTNGNTAAVDVGRRDISSGGKGVGTYNFNGGILSVTGSGQNEIVGDSGQGTFLHNNAAGNAQNNDATGALIIGNQSTSVGVYTLGGPASNSLTIQSIDIGGAVGGAGQATGTFNFDTVKGDLAVLTIKATSGVGLTVGDSGTGTFNQGGGALALTNSDLVLGAQLGLGGGGKGGTYNLTGGSLTSGAKGNTAQKEIVGDQTTGVFNQNNAAAGAANTLFGALIIGNQSGGAGTYNLGGAAANALSARTIDIGAGLASTGVLNFDTAGGDAATLAITALTGTVGLTVGDQGSGTLNQGGGVIALTSDLVVGNQLQGAPDQGTYNLSGAAAVKLSANNETIGNDGVGAFNQTGGVNTANVQLLVGAGATGNGTYTLDGAVAGETLNTPRIDIGVQDGAVGVFNYDLKAGANAALALQGVAPTVTLIVGDAGQGTLNQGGGAITVNSDLQIGAQATGNGTYDLSGGTLKVPGAADQELVGDQGTGLFNQTGGTNTVTFNLIVGNQDGSDGAYTLGGAASSLVAGAIDVGAQTGATGVFNFDTGNGDAATIALAAGPGPVPTELIVGDAGQGTFNQGGGTLALNGNAGVGVNTSATAWGNWDLAVGNQSGGKGTYNLTGGTLAAAFGVIGDTGRGTFDETGGSATFGIKGAAVNSQGTTLSVGDQNLSSGTLEVQAATLAVSGNLIVGNQGQGSIQQSTGTQSSDSVTVAGTMILGDGYNAIGTYSMSGTTFTAAGLATIGAQGNGTFTETLGTATFDKGVVLASMAPPAGAGKGAPPSAGYVNLLEGILSSQQPSIIGDTGQGTFTQKGGTAQFLSPNAAAALIIGGDPSASPGAGLGGGTGVYTLGSSNAPATLVVEATNAGKLVDGTVQIGSNGGVGTFNFNMAAGDAATVENAGAAQGKAATPGPIFQVGVNGTGTLNEGGGTLTLGDLQIATNTGAGTTKGTVSVTGADTKLVTADLEVGALPASGASKAGGQAVLDISGGAAVVVDPAAAVTVNLQDGAQIGAHGADTFQGMIGIYSGSSMEIGAQNGAAANTLLIDANGNLVGHGLVDSTSSGSITLGDGETTPNYLLSVVDNGVIEANGGPLVIHGALSGDGQVEIGANATFEVSGAVSSQVTIEFQGTDATLIVDDPAAFKGAIEGFQAGDSIEYLNLPVTDDFNAGGKSDFLIENTAGAVVTGEVVNGAAQYAQVAGLGPEWKFGGNGDFLGDGKVDFLIENAAGAVDVGEVSGGQTSYTQVAGLGPEWSFRGTGDFLGDTKSDFLIENTAGAVFAGEVVSGAAQYTQLTALGPEWKFVGVGDYLGEGHDQFLIENAAGAVDVADWTGGAIHFTQVAGLGSEWSFRGAGDFLGDGKADFLIENTAGAVFAGEVVNGAAQYTQLTALGPEWKFVGVGDYLGEGHDQFLIENAAGAVDVADWTGGAIHFTQVAGLGSEWAFH